MIEAVLLGALLLGVAAAVLPPLNCAVHKQKAYKLLADPNPSRAGMRRVIGVLSHSNDAESKRLGDDLYKRLTGKSPRPLPDDDTPSPEWRRNP